MFTVKAERKVAGFQKMRFKNLLTTEYTEHAEKTKAPS
jgi:hypothetical protein